MVHKHFTFSVDVELDPIVIASLMFPEPAKGYRVNRELPLQIASDLPTTVSETVVWHRRRLQAQQALTEFARSWAVAGANQTTLTRL